MTVINRAITNEQVIPLVDTEVFANHEGARFATGIIAVGSQLAPGFDSVFAGYRDLRRDVMVTQTGQLHPDELIDGVDQDGDDERAVHFATVEHHRKSNGGLDYRVVSASRLIIKGFGKDEGIGRPLPTEEFCPEVFTDSPAPSGSAEVSRFMARHERAAIQGILSLNMYTTVQAYIQTHGIGPTYAVVEPWYITHLRSSGIPCDELADPRYIEHYRANNLPVRIDTEGYAKHVEAKTPGLLAEIALGQALGGMRYMGRVEPVRQARTPQPVEAVVAA